MTKRETPFFSDKKMKDELPPPHFSTVTKYPYASFIPIFRFGTDASRAPPDGVTPRSQRACASDLVGEAHRDVHVSGVIR